ncbi:hypothetical protein D3C78_1858370 [compost metagenome]
MKRGIAIRTKRSLVARNFSRAAPTWVSAFTARAVTTQVVRLSGSMKRTVADPPGPVCTVGNQAAVSLKFLRTRGSSVSLPGPPE